MFLNGNRLPQRFASHPRPLFIVVETGFGIGLNFLALCQAFADFRQAFPDARLQRLHFISFENSHCGRLIWQQRTGAGRNSPLMPKSYSPNGLCPCQVATVCCWSPGVLRSIFSSVTSNTLLAHVDASIDNQVDA